MRWIWILIVIVVLGVAAYLYAPKAAAPTGESQATTTPQAAEATEAPEAKLLGTWRSDTDAKFTREFKTGGVVLDSYVGEPTAPSGGEWSVVDPSVEVIGNVNPANLVGTTVIKVVWEGGVETTYFAINSLTDTTLKTTDLTGQGSVTTYTKVN